MNIPAPIFHLSYIKQNPETLKNLFLHHNIVLVNGCFDIFHAGHLYYLQEAKRLGGLGAKLVVGLNSDTSIKKQNNKSYKHLRPINNQNDRAALLSNLRVVDAIVIFNQKTAATLIYLIKPDTYVKSEKAKNELPPDEIKALNTNNTKIFFIPDKTINKKNKKNDKVGAYSSSGILKELLA